MSALDRKQTLGIGPNAHPTGRENAFVANPFLLNISDVESPPCGFVSQWGGSWQSIASTFWTSRVAFIRRKNWKPTTISKRLKRRGG